MNKDNAFLSYLRSRKEIFFVAFLLLLGLLFLWLGTSELPLSAKAKDVSYEDALQNDVEALLSNVNGVGKVSVLIRFEEAEKTVSYGQSEDSLPTVASVTVVCDGGNDPAVQAELTKMLCAHFGIGANRVTVLKRKA